MSTPVSWPAIGGSAYNIPAAGEVNWQALSNFLIALGNGAQSILNTKFAIRTAVTSPVTLATATDCIVVTNLGTPGAVLVNLPAGITGQVFFVVDGKGDAATNNVTIDPNGAETINGAATYVLNKNRAGILFSFDGTGWTILAEFTNIAAGTIPRSSIAPGTPDQVVINDGSGNLSSEAALAKVRGGTGIDNSAVTFPSTGVVVTEAGTETLTNKTIDGDLNTIQDLAVTTLKTVIGQALTFLSFDASGAPIATKAVPTGVVVGTTDTQALTNKDFQGATASNTSRITVPSGTLAALTALTRKEGTIVYATDTDKLYTDDGVQLTPVGSGSGAGFKNYVPNPNDANANWTASGAGITVATSTSASRPDNITQPNTIVATRVSGTTAYAYTRFTLDAADYNKLLQIQWDQSYAGTAGDYAVQIWSNTLANYTGTSTQLVTPVTNIPSATGTFNTNFTSPGSAAPYLELRIVAAAGTTPLYLNNVTVTPGILVQGAAITEWQAYTPTYSAGFGTVTNNVAYWRQVGSSIEIVGACTTGTTTTANASISLPSGLTINSAALPIPTANNTGENNIVGWYSSTNGASSGGYLIASPGASTTAFYIAIRYTTAGGTGAASTVSSAQGELNNNSLWNWKVILPISQWFGNSTVSLGQGAQVEYAYTTGTWDAADSTTAYGPQGIAMTGSLSADRNKTVTWQYPIQSGDLITVQLQDTGSTTGNWIDVSDLAPYLIQNTLSYGAFVQAQTTNSTTLVTFNRYRRATGTTFGAAGENWNTSFRWRVRKVSASTPVGFGLASVTAPGLFNTGQNPGVINGTDASLGNVGEYYIQSRVRSASISITTGTQTNVLATPLTLPPGDWDITGSVAFSPGATTSITIQQAAISQTSATFPSSDTTAVPNSAGEMRMIVSTPAQVPQQDNAITLPTHRVSISVSTTFYLLAASTFTISSNSVWGALWARRVR